MIEEVKDLKEELIEIINIIDNINILRKIKFLIIGILKIKKN
ncbi:hypothetical protein [Romboutsia sp. MSSM.1001216sp_RTP31141st1_G3_RTP31141_220114]